MINEASCNVARHTLEVNALQGHRIAWWKLYDGPTIVADYPEYTILSFTPGGRPQITMGVSPRPFVEQGFPNNLLQQFMSTEIGEYLSGR